MPLRVTSLYRYPVKSAGAEALPETRVTFRGFAQDRRWMVVEPDGAFITLREHPRLMYVTVASEGDGSGVVLRADGMPACQVERPDEAMARRSVVVWDDRVDAVDAGDEPAAWLSDFLGSMCRLVYMPDSSRRVVDPRYGQAGDIVSFADGYPILLLTEASLADLNGRLEESVTMARFRPNIVVGGAGSYAEDGWREIRIGDVSLRVVKPCARCVIVTLDPVAGLFQKEPLRTLAGYRRDGNKVLFGQNLIPSNEGTIRLGDPVEVVR